MTRQHTFFKFTLLFLMLATAVACTTQATTPDPESIPPTETATAVVSTLPPTATTMPTTTPVIDIDIEVTAVAPSILTPPLLVTASATPAVLFEKPATNTLANDPVIQERIVLAQKILAGQLDIPLADIDFINYEPIVWPDGSLGCPTPGKTTPPVEIPGYLINLKTNDKNYRFHGGAGRRPFLCTLKPSVINLTREIMLPPTP